MRSAAPTPDAYIAELDAERAREIRRVRDLVNSAIQPGFDERMAFGMISWDVPLEISGPTYNKQPLVYVALAAQKRHNALYLTCAYTSPERSERLTRAFSAAGKKLDMGKSCIRFRSADELELDAIAAEIGSLTPAQFVSLAKAARQSSS